MSIVGMLIMWAWTVVVYVAWSTWVMGEESDRRSKYWARYENK